MKTEPMKQPNQKEIHPSVVRLKAMRKAAGLSQVMMSVKLGISHSILSKWESGNEQPSDKMLDVLTVRLPRFAAEHGLDESKM